MINVRITRRTLTVFLSIAAIFAGIIFAVAYHTVRKLTFAGDYAIYGRCQSQLASEIREEILKRPDVQAIDFTSDNLTLKGFLVTRPHARANMLICHGYKSAKEYVYDYIDMFPLFNIFMFDFRAHGQSDGTVISIGCHEYKDVIAAMNCFKSHVDTKLPTIILGISMGGASSLKATEIKPDLCDALIIDSTFAKLHATMLRSFSEKSGLPYYPFYPVVRSLFQYYADCDVHQMSPEESVKKIQQPILFMHSCVDKLIPPADVISLYANAQNKHSRIWIGPRCRHGTLHSYHSELYKKKVLNFLKKAVPRLKF